MNFMNGMWMVKEGVELHKARQSYEIERLADGVSILAPTVRIDSRGHTLNNPVLEIKLSSYRNDVISVKITHFRGAAKRGPSHDIRRFPADISVDETDNEVIFKSGETSARIRKSGDFRIEFYYKGRLLTSTGDFLTGPAYVTDASGAPHVREMLALGVGEYVYGLGERFGPFVKNGQQIDLWAEDGGTCTTIAYKNVPLYLSNRRYGVFVNYTGKVSYEIATEVVSKVQFTVPGESLEYMVIGGENLRNVMEAYTDLTGKPAVPPEWSFGLWLSTSFTTNYDEDTVNSFIDGMAERDIPLRIFHYDCFWMREFRWCDLTFDKRMFPDSKAMLSRLKEKGLKICLWINPYIAQQSALFDEAAENGYLLKKPNGDVWQWDLWQAGMACVDFTNPSAAAWFQSKLQVLIDLGANCFKTDFGERIPTDVAYYDGSDPERMHHYYTHL
jgi:alpha-D-xyloside xylohydrolase